MSAPQHLKERVFSGVCEWPVSRLVFVTAGGHDAAVAKMRRLLADLYDCRAEQVSLYSVYSYREMIGQGMSTDEDLRLFETGWKSGTVAAWAADALILTEHETTDFLRSVQGRIPAQPAQPGYVSYRDLLAKDYDLNIGSVVGCGLDRLDRTCTADEIDAAVVYYRANENDFASLPIGERREQVARFVRNGCRFS